MSNLTVPSLGVVQRIYWHEDRNSIWKQVDGLTFGRAILLELKDGKKVGQHSKDQLGYRFAAVLIRREPILQ